MGEAAARIAPAFALALALLLVLVGAGTGAVTGAGVERPVHPAVAGPTGPAQTTPGAAPPETTTVIRIRLRSNGHARWNVTTTMALDSAVDRRAFDRLAEEHQQGDLDALALGPFEKAAGRASQVTGRPMAIRGESRGAASTRTSGHLSLEFTWTNFSRTKDSEIRLGDVFQTPTGTWLPEIGPDQVLVIEFPPGYSVRDSSRRLTNGTIRVHGPATFEPGRPAAVLRETDTGQITNDGLALQEILGLVVGVAFLAGVIVYLLMRRRRRGQPTGGEAEDGSTDAAGGGVGPAVEDAHPEPIGDESGTTGAGEEPVDEPAEATADEDVVDQPLLSDEERVERLLSANDGRMKQVDIVAETGWSNAKVSQLLSSMDEEGRIEKLRIGRENLISLPEDDGDD